jgi:hypothetical protein
VSLSAISANSAYNYAMQTLQNQANLQQFQQQFEQLGQALQSGNLSGAQTDFDALQDDASPVDAGSSTTSSSSLAQSFSQLGQALESGNLSAAQQDYSSIQQDFQSQGTQSAHGPRHHHSDGSNDDQNQISQTFQQLGQELQAGDVSGSQQAYSSLQQEIQAFTPNGAAMPVEGTAISGLSVMA